MSDEIYKSLFENSQSVMLIIHPKTGRIIDANKSACKYYGYEKHELTKLNIQKINTLSEKQILEEMENARAERRNCFHFQHRLANGEIRDVEVYSGPITIGDENVLYSIVHDISKRKRIEKQVQIEKKFSESLINSLPGVMYVFDQFGRFKRWNNNFEVVTGYSANQIEEMSPHDFVAVKDKKRITKAIEQVFNEGSVCVEAGFLTSQGQVIPYLFTGYKFVQQNMNYLVGVGLDISDRVIIENEKENLIAKLHDTLSQVKQLSGLLPICASCKKIRDDKGYWNQIELYIREHSEAEFSHGICPECAKKIYPELDLSKLK